MDQQNIHGILDPILEDRFAMSSTRLMYIEMGILLGVNLLVMVVLYYVSRFVFSRFIPRLTARTATNWDDKLVDRHFFARIAHVVTAIYLKAVAPVIFAGFPSWSHFVSSATTIYLIFILIRVIFSFVDAGKDVFNSKPQYQDKPLQSYSQLVKIIFGFLGGIVILSVIISKNPVYILTGLGAVSAVLILVFQNTLLGFVASIQLSSNDMLRIGDWIGVPNYGADGTVEEINLTTVKVRNWDKTITTVPTYSLISGSFKNWRGMEESGGRRMMRTVNLKASTVRFADDDLIERVSKYEFIKNYMRERRQEIKQHNKDNQVDTSFSVNGRRMTNLGIFRQYMLEVVKHNSQVNHEMIHMVRALEPTEDGVGLQVYCFLKEKRWVYYESVQGHMFDHIISVVQEFGLELHESPTGTDVREGIQKLGEPKVE